MRCDVEEFSLAFWGLPVLVNVLVTFVWLANMLALANERSWDSNPRLACPSREC